MKNYIPYVLLIGLNTIAMEKQDPFAVANELYDSSHWKQAYVEYDKVHSNIKKDDCDLTSYVRGSVNFADVTFAYAATELGKGNKEQAKNLMLKACAHWSWRLVARQFGRTPLDNEWDGSDIKDKTLLVYSERDGGAFGDTFYMTPMLRYVKEKGARVVFVPQKPLAQLYQAVGTKQAKYVDQVVVRGSDLPEHDKAIYLWSILKYYLEDVALQDQFP